MTYTRRYDWEAVNEVKGWEEPNLRDSIHKVTVVEYETGDKNQQQFNFTPEQTSSGRWQKHVDNWIESMQNQEKKSVLE